MRELYLTDTGNVIYVNSMENDKVILNRVGKVDTQGNSSDIQDCHWATITNEYFKYLISHGIFIKVVRLYGGAFVEASAYDSREPFTTD